MNVVQSEDLFSSSVRAQKGLVSERIGNREFTGRVTKAVDACHWIAKKSWWHHRQLLDVIDHSWAFQSRDIVFIPSFAEAFIKASSDNVSVQPSGNVFPDHIGHETWCAMNLVEEMWLSSNINHFLTGSNLIVDLFLGVPSPGLISVHVAILIISVWVIACCSCGIDQEESLNPLWMLACIKLSLVSTHGMPSQEELSWTAIKAFDCPLVEVKQPLLSNLRILD